MNRTLSALAALLFLCSSCLLSTSCDGDTTNSSSVGSGNGLGGSGNGNSRGGSTTSSAVTLGMQCDSSAECSTGETCTELVGPNNYMIFRQCTKPCATDADCSSGRGLVCGVIGDGSRGCLNSCSETSAIPCIDGVPTACAAAPAGECLKCGCPDDQRCASGVGCEAKHGVGEDCESDDDCKTDNCGKYTGQCRVAVGQNCDSSNCDLCISSKSGWSYCSRACDYSECGTAGVCLGQTGGNDYWCRPQCKSYSDSTCPGSCKYATGDTIVIYCDCPDCSVARAKQPFATRCESSSVCESGNCLSRTYKYDSWNQVDLTNGFCSQLCSADSDCPDNSACVDISCEGSYTDSKQSCGSHCLPKCDESIGCGNGTCHSMTSLGGVSGSFCDPRVADNTACRSNGDCISSRCSTNTCTPTNGKANGGSCLTSNECASANCVGGTCRGQSMLGDSCSSAYDCSVGCCSSSSKCTSC